MITVNTLSSSFAMDTSPGGQEDERPQHPYFSLKGMIEEYNRLRTVPYSSKLLENRDEGTNVFDTSNEVQEIKNPPPFSKKK